MTIKILTSGSKGNVTVVEVGGELILLDCGKAVAWTLERLNWRLPSAILVTHEHGDHAKAVADWLKRSVDVYLTAGTCAALELKRRHNLHTIFSGDFTKIIVEANFSEPVLLNSGLDEYQKLRVLQNHLSIEQAITFLKDYPTAEVHLIHISTRHGDGNEFRARAVEATGNENITAN